MEKESSVRGTVLRQITARLWRLQKALKGELLDVFGLIYILWWDFKFRSRRRIGRWAAMALPPLLVVEFVSSFFHFLPSPELDDILRYVGFGCLALCAFIVLLHHWYLDHRVDQQQRLLNAIQLVATEIVRCPIECSAEEARILVYLSLRALTYTLETLIGRQVLISGSIVCEWAEGTPFTILEQEPRDRYDARLELDPDTSAAGRVAKESIGTILYVPWTRFRHGIQISFESTGLTDHPVRHSVTEIVQEAMEHIGSPAPEELGAVRGRRSLLCIKVPLQEEATSSLGLRGPRLASLCVESNRRDCHGELDFDAIQVFANLIGVVLQQLKVAAPDRIL